MTCSKLQVTFIQATLRKKVIWGNARISSHVVLRWTWEQPTTLELSISFPSCMCLPNRAMMVIEIAWMAHLSACRVRIAMQTWRRQKNPVWSRQQKKDQVNKHCVRLHACMCSWLSMLENLHLCCWRARRGRTADSFSLSCVVTTLERPNECLCFYTDFSIASWP